MNYGIEWMVYVGVACLVVFVIAYTVKKNKSQ